MTLYILLGQTHGEYESFPIFSYKVERGKRDAYVGSKKLNSFPQYDPFYNIKALRKTTRQKSNTNHLWQKMIYDELLS